MRPSLPTANHGPGVIPGGISTGQTIAGLGEQIARIIGSSGRASAVQARTLTVKPGGIDEVPFVVDLTGSEFTADIMRVLADASTAVMLINNNGTLFLYRGVSVLDSDDAQPKFKVDQTDGVVQMGDGTHSLEDILEYDYDSLT